MKRTELLKTIGLTTYEAATYESIISLGTAPASAIYKAADVPFGKIYEVLSRLEELHLIEVQQSRPKKYRAINPQVAFKRFLTLQKQRSDAQLEQLSTQVARLEEEIYPEFEKQTTEKKFWRSAIEEEAFELLELTLDDMQHELCILATMEMDCSQIDKKLAFFSGVIRKAIKKNISVRVLLHNANAKILHRHGKELLDQPLLEIRETTMQPTNSFFLIDKREIVFSITNPLSPGKLLALLRMEDKDLLDKLSSQYETMWKSGKKV